MLMPRTGVALSSYSGITNVQMTNFAMVVFAFNDTQKLLDQHVRPAQCEWETMCEMAIGGFRASVN